MSAIIRRFAIFTLIVAIFAIGVSAIVTHPSRKDLRAYTGLELSCVERGPCVATG